MHEVSVVQNIIDLAKLQVENAGARKVDQIELEIGQLAGIEMEAFQFAWEVCTPNTVLSEAEQKILRPAASAKCAECGHEFVVQQLYDPCPDCGAFFAKLLTGRELKVKSLLVS